MRSAGVTPPKTWEEFESVTAPALKEAGYIPLAQSPPAVDLHREPFFSRATTCLSATNDNGYGDGETKILSFNTTEIKSHFTPP